ncbi:DUF4437 domain-containing protein [Reichenbachiella versicolor]|uniref:DUF4437 domain-containing protein n=1 Tax=Reichenbachiella versicolor TaxID=1821036 RepID=UPI000D6E74E6|nr:DUF4437 domain-containing protein [Reichenbachiella versicolor]
MFKKVAILLFIVGVSNSCETPKQESTVQESTIIENPTNKVLLSSDVVWEKLNPARGDQSPQAGTLWGDRKAEDGVPTGFLAKFVDGFSSPPHIHNATYRAVVIKGLVHNDDPKAANMWMKPGSFWTQPVGESHITSAKGDDKIIALVEINKGPYLVRPISEAYDSGERPINIDVSNIIWLDSETINWISPKSNVEVSFLLESNGLRSLFIKLPKGFKGEIETDGTLLHSVVISGELDYLLPVEKEVKSLDTGSYFGSTDKAVHTVTNKSAGETVVYVRTNGEVRIK